MNYKADVRKVLDQEFGTDAPITLRMVKPPLLRSSANRGAKGDNNANTESQPETQQDIDNEVDISETIEDEIPSGIKLSNEITDFIAWRVCTDEYKSYFYNIGARKKKELYAISQTIRCCQEPSLVPPPRYVPKVYLRATVSMLRQRADKIMAGANNLDVIQTSLKAYQQAPGTFVTPFVPRGPHPQGHPSFGAPPDILLEDLSRLNTTVHNRDLSRCGAAVGAEAPTKVPRIITVIEASISPILVAYYLF